MNTTLIQRRNIIARARDQRDYGKLVYTVIPSMGMGFKVCGSGSAIEEVDSGFALARYGKPQPHLGYWLDRETAQIAANMYHRTNPYDRLQSRKIRAHVARMAKG
jgi:hypothetical protein